MPPYLTFSIVSEATKAIYFAIKSHRDTLHLAIESPYWLNRVTKETYEQNAGCRKFYLKIEASSFCYILSSRKYGVPNLTLKEFFK